MLCDKCKKKEAVLHIHELRDGKLIKLNLCEDCAAIPMDGNSSDAPNIPGLPFSMADMLANVSKLAGELAAAGTEKKEASSEKRECPVCHWTLKKFASSNGKVGCPECYKIFQKEIWRSFISTRQNNLHLGKRPVGTTMDSPVIKRQQLDALEKELQKFIAAENYEAAADCRDRIKLLHDELYNRGGSVQK